MEEYLAHIAQDDREQTLLAHLEGTAALCSHFAAAFAPDAARLAGLAHDLGKYAPAFQRRLRGDPHKVDHATAGAWECCQRNQPFVAFAVAGHHSGLPDGGSRADPPDLPTFFARMNRAQMKKLEPYSAWTQQLSLPAAPPPDAHLTPAEMMFWTRMLYSCLVDADFLDTEAFMEDKPPRLNDAAPWEDLEQRLRDYIAGWSSPQTPLNRQRWAILQQCLAAGADPARRPGLYTLTVPTGGGKTVASLAFALQHARTCGLQRIIYVLPYTAIIEQNAQVFRDILGAENVLEHHAGISYDLEQEADPLTMRLAKATENWDMPLVVTTAVQFFESLFGSRSSKCRKLHNLAQSVIIFDEAQMLPIPCLRPCIFAMAQLVKHYGASAVLCTATQPALTPLFRAFLPTQTAVELCPPATYRADVFCRVQFQTLGPIGWEALAAKLQNCPQVLCVVNTRKSAQTLYRLLQGPGCFHLSTLLCPAHRKSILQEIRQRLEDGLPCRVVSTSLIEAGVDVDFPQVFREEAGLDSILQTAGRCNREGSHPAQDCTVAIFQGPDAPPDLLRTNIDAGRRAMARFERPDSAQAMAAYFSELLDLKGKAGQDKHGILLLMEDPATLLPFRTVAERFHLLDENTRTVYIPWQDGAALIERLQAGEYTRTLFRQLAQYGVNIYAQHFRELYDAGALELLEDDSAILTDSSLYAADTGLMLQVSSGNAIIY